MKRGLTVIVMCLVCLSTSSRRSQAADLANVLTDYTLTSWGERDGLPSSVVRAIAQDKEGYLWLGTDAGPVRFDGARFRRWEDIFPMAMPQASVRALYVTRDGTLWFGFGERGGISRLRDGTLKTYGAGDGLAEGAVSLIFEETNGTLWAASTAGLFQLDGERWVLAAAGLPKGPVYSATADRAGQLLIGTSAGLYGRSQATGAFSSLTPGQIVRDVTADRAGSIWVTDPAVGFRSLGAHVKPQGQQESQGGRLLFDSVGNLWIGTMGQGLWRLRFDDASGRSIVERATTLAGFSDECVTSLFQDIEGNLWAGTLDGLNRLVPHRITPVTELGVVRGVEATPDGNVWVGTIGSLVTFSPQKGSDRRRQEELPGPVNAMHTDEHGTLWVAAGAQLLKFDNGRRSAVSLPGARPPHQITAISSDLKGGMWITDEDQGLLHWSDGRIDAVPLPPQIKGSRLEAIHTDRSARLWIAMANEHVASVDAVGTVRVFGREDGLDTGAYRIIYEAHDGAIWFGGNAGLSRFNNGRFSTLHIVNGVPPGPLTAIVEDDDRSLWIGSEGTQAGVSRIAPEELEKAFQDPLYRVQFTAYDKFDGFAGTPKWLGSQAAVRSKDGRLWFVAGRGVSIIDPRALRSRPAAASHVRIEGAVADGHLMFASSPGRMAPHTARIEIDYRALNLTSSLKARFKYQLVGFDTDWIDAGSRRQAFYTNLPPRHYDFKMIASNDDGTRSNASVWGFDIEPAFYQTYRFMALCAVGLLAALGCVWQLRLRRMRGQFSPVLGERARLSREIHDTLLQGLFGVALRCEAIAGVVDAATPSLRTYFQQMRNDVQDYIQEAQESIQDLRSASPRDLPAALLEAGERATAGTGVTFTFHTRGKACAGIANFEKQLLRIGREAVVNAIRHARARHVRVHLEYDNTRLTLRIADDGCGFDPATIHDPDCHYGLRIMKERAESIGGRCRIESTPGHGTGIEVTAPVAPLVLPSRRPASAMDFSFGRRRKSA